MGNDSHARLSAEHRRLQLEFLQTELDLSSSLVDMAQTERSLGNRENADRSLAHAEQGYQTIERFLTGANGLGEDHVRNLRARLADLRGALDTAGSKNR